MATRHAETSSSRPSAHEEHAAYSFEQATPSNVEPKGMFERAFTRMQNWRVEFERNPNPQMVQILKRIIAHIRIAQSDHRDEDIVLVQEPGAADVDRGGGSSAAQSGDRRLAVR